MYVVVGIVTFVFSSLLVTPPGEGVPPRCGVRDEQPRSQMPIAPDTADASDVDGGAAKAVAPDGVPTAKTVRIAVVVSKHNPIDSLKRDEIRKLFLRQTTMWPGGTAITVYERHTKNAIREQFSSAVLGRKPSELREYWLNLKLTRGLKAPKTCRSAELVKQYLLRVEGGVGYMYEHEVDDTVKSVAILEVDCD